MRAGWSAYPAAGPVAFEPPGAIAPAPGSPAAFLDRDGTLNAGVHDPETGGLESPLRVEDVWLLPGAATAARRLAAAGYALVCVSNQPAAAKGSVEVERLLEVHERVLALLGGQGVPIAASRLCLHHPTGSVAALTGLCSCRKPAPGMLLDAADSLALDMARSVMIGDTDSDVQAGAAAGVRTALVEYPGSAHKRGAAAAPDVSAPDLAGAADRLLPLVER